MSGTSDSTTAHIGLTKPGIGGSLDSWGQKLNADLGILDGLVHGLMPVGSVIDFAGGVLPTGWLLCDGSAVSRTTYSDLFGAIGTNFGTGDGVTTFNLPDLRGRLSVGAGTTSDGITSMTFALGSAQGNYNATIDQAHLPNYALTVGPDGAHQHNYTMLTAAYAAASTNISNNFYSISSYVTIQTDSTISIHSHAVWLGGGATPLSMESPLLAMQRAIYAGLQALT